MSALSIGLSALNVDQQVINVLGQNIANANTPGYHQQVANLSSVTTGGPVGDGVQVQQVTRQVNNLIDAAVNSNASDTAATTAQLQILQTLQSNLNASGDGSLGALLDNFFTQASQLASDPGDTAQQSVFLNAASSVAGAINSLSQQISTQSGNIDGQAQQLVSQANTLSTQIAQLNQSIQSGSIAGNSTNDLQDQRDELVSQMAGIMDVQTVNQPNGVVNVVASGTPVVVGGTSQALAYSVNSNGTAVVVPEEPSGSTGAPLMVRSGQLAGLLTTANVDLPQLQNQLQTLTNQLVRNVDEVQATGVGSAGPQSTIEGTRAVSDPSVMLNNAGLTFPPQAGSLYVTMTNLSTGQQTLTQLNINPATESLNDVAAALNTVPNLQATVNTQTNTLDLLTKPGYGVDFTGQLQSTPQNVSIAGTTVPTLSGSYTGSTNDTYTYQVSGAGTVGVTPGLSLNVQNSAGQTIGNFNIGQGYSPGSALPAVNGVSASLAAGTVVNNDSFSTPVVAQPDSAGILTALGINTLFSGDDASNLAVNSNLMNNPGLLSTSRSGQPGDGSSVNLIAAAGNAPVFSGSQTFSQYFANMASTLGANVQALTQQQTTQQSIGQSLQAQQQSVSGVDPNEELVSLLQFQQAFQMASKYVSVVGSNLSDLLNILQ